MINLDMLSIDSSFHEENTTDKKPIHALMEAIVERALRDAMGTAYTETHVLRSARKWLHSNRKTKWSFMWIAEELPLSTRFIERIRNLIPRFSSQPLIRSGNDFVELPLSALKVKDPSRTPTFFRKVVQLEPQLMHSRRKRL